LGLTFVDPNSWIEEGDFVRDGLHLNGRGKRRLGNYMLESVDLMSKDRQGVRSHKFWKMEIIERGIPGKHGDYRSEHRRFYMKKMDQ